MSLMKMKKKKSQMMMEVCSELLSVCCSTITKFTRMLIRLRWFQLDNDGYPSEY